MMCRTDDDIVADSHDADSSHDFSSISSDSHMPVSTAESVFDPNMDSDTTILGEYHLHFCLSDAHSKFPLENDSPYPEVRSAVANYDDTSMPVSTLRAWTIGIFFAIILPGLNQFFYFRYPTVVIGGVSFHLCILRLL
jgi:hypothetical protein